MVKDIMNLRTNLNEEYNADDYDVTKVSDGHVTFKKKGSGEIYHCQRGASKWRCTCTGYKYRGKCKHVDVAARMCADPGSTRFPRDVIEKSIEDIMPRLRQVCPDAEVVGSYRRGKADCKDIDVMCPCSEADFDMIKEQLKECTGFKPRESGANIVRGYVDFDGNKILMDINRLNENMNPALALLYRTGPASLNIAMRQKAKEMEGSLSENELIIYGKQCEVHSEEDVFKYLGFKYLTPEEREVKELEPCRSEKPRYYQAYVNGTSIGPAPSRAFAKQQVKNIRELTKKLDKANITINGDRLDIRFTVHEEEVQNVATDYTVMDSIGNEINSSRIDLEIHPVVKLHGKRVNMDTNVQYMGQQLPLGTALENIWQSAISSTLDVPQNRVGKKVASKVTMDKGLLYYKSVPFGVPGLKNPNKDKEDYHDANIKDSESLK